MEDVHVLATGLGYSGDSQARLDQVSLPPLRHVCRLEPTLGHSPGRLRPKELQQELCTGVRPGCRCRLRQQEPNDLSRMCPLRLAEPMYNMKGLGKIGG